MGGGISKRRKDIMFKKDHAGFTLIELLVVIAIIALLLAVIMPALNIAKQQASAARCMSNERQLAMIWLLYAEDKSCHIGMWRFRHSPLSRVGIAIMAV